MTYRIYTEDTNRDAILSIANRWFPDGFTAIPAIGYWHGQREDSLVIEVSDVPRAFVDAVAEDIRTLNHQQAVLINAFPDTHETLITAPQTNERITTQ